MSITQLMLLTGDLSAARDVYLTQHSLRFDGTNDYLNRVVSASDRRKWTWSGWAKKDDLSRRDYLFSGGASGDTSNLFYIQWERNHTGGNNELGVVWREGSTTTRSLYTTASYNDTSAWYHVVLSVDTTQSAASDKMKLYVDGTEITSFLTDNRSTIGTNDPLSVNAAGNMCMGAYAYDLSSTSSRFKGLMAEVHFIDGTALDASYFGETRGGVWLPKEVTDVTYGNNGFYLDFAGNDTGAVLLLNGSSLTDDLSNAENDLSSYNNTTVTGGGAVTLGTTDGTTVVHPYGTTGVPYLDFPEEDGLAIPTTFDLSGGDWTFECWVYFNSISQFQSIFSSAETVGPQLALSGSPDVDHIQFNLTSNSLQNTTAISADTWYHVALTYNSGTSPGTITLYVNGTGTSSSHVDWDNVSDQYLGGPNQNTTVSNNGHILVLGVNRSNGYPLDGKLTDVRFTRGIARDIAAEWTNGVYTSALTNTPEYLGDFGVDRTTNSNDFSVEGNITADDQLIDTPNLRFESLTTAASGVTLSDANYVATMPSGAQNTKTRTNNTISGKVYFELVLHSTNNSSIGLTTATDSEEFVGQNSTSLGWFISPGSALQAWTNSSRNTNYEPTNTSGTYASGDILSLAIDTTATTIQFYKNGQAYGDSVDYSGWSTSSVYFTLGNYVSGQTYPMNFGQDHTFAGQKPVLLTLYSDANGVGEFYYEPPSGFLALAQKYS